MISVFGTWNRITARRGIARKVRTGHRNGSAVELTKAESRYMFDRIARRELGMSGEEFLRRLDRGDLPDSPVVEQLALLAGGARTGL